MIRSKNTKSASYNQISGINITPFTDICLVLLIIFMVTANTLIKDNNVPLKLPEAVSTEEALPKSVTVHIRQNQDLYVNEEQVTPEALKTTLQRYKTEDTKILVIRADESVPYQSVISAIDVGRQVGLVDIALATRKPAVGEAAH